MCLPSDMGQGVAVHLEFKFKSTLPTRRQGLATYLAQNIVTPILQKHSIVADGEWGGCRRGCGTSWARGRGQGRAVCSMLWVSDAQVPHCTS